MSMLPWIAALVALCTLLYLGSPLWLATAFFALLLLSASFFTNLSMAVLLPCWIVFGLFAALLNVKPLRQKLISRFAMTFVSKQMPPISQTERAAIDAGDIWWDAKLFQGMPDWNDLHKEPLSTLSTEEKAFLDNQVETLCGMIDGWKQEQTRELSKEVWDYIKKEGFLSMLIPKAYGGLEFSAFAQSTIVTKIASRDMSTAVTVMVPNSLGPAELLLKYGTDEQKNYYLPRLAKSEDVPCFGLTGPEAGSDAGSMVDKGVITYGEHKGEKVLGIRLTFEKRYITLAPVASVIGLAFKCYDPDGLIGQERECGITLCLLPATHPGVQTGEKNYPIGSSFANGTIKGQDVFIPLTWVIGGSDKIGHGWRMLMECLSEGRGISLPALSTASGKLAYRTTGAYSRIRKQFNVSIGEFEGIQEALGRIGGYTYMLESLRVVTASAINQGIKPAVVSAIAKYHMTEMARTAVCDAMDVHGGRAVIVGPSNYIANTYSMMPVAITVEGANILTRNLIIFGQGAIRCHPYLLDEILCAEKGLSALPEFDDALFKHIGYTITNTVRCWVQGLTGGLFITKVPNDSWKAYYKQLSRMSTALACIADMTMIMLGGELKRKENLSARLGDVLSHLYIASSVLKYHQGTQAEKGEDVYVRWSLDHCLAQMEGAFDLFFQNFPNKFVAFFMRKLVFPYGRVYHRPYDKASTAISKSMMKDTPIRRKLSEYMYVGDLDYSVGMVDTTLTEEEAAAPLLKMLRKARKEKRFNGAMTFDEVIQDAKRQNIINEEEFKQLDQYGQHYSKAIAVDAFKELH